MQYCTYTVQYYTGTVLYLNGINTGPYFQFNYVIEILYRHKLNSSSNRLFLLNWILYITLKSKYHDIASECPAVAEVRDSEHSSLLAWLVSCSND